jgi:hypothetical protein
LTSISTADLPVLSCPGGDASDAVEAIVIADLTVEALTAKVAEPPTRSSQAIDGSNYDSTVCDSMFLTSI